MAVDDGAQVVGDRERVGGEDAQVEQPLAQIGLVGVDDVAAQQLVAGEDHLVHSCP